MKKGFVFPVLLSMLIMVSILGSSAQLVPNLELNAGEVHTLMWATPENITATHGDLIWDVQAKLGGVAVTTPVDSSFPIKDGSIVKVDPASIDLGNRSIEINTTTGELVYSLSNDSPIVITIDNSDFEIGVLEFILLIVPVIMVERTGDVNIFDFLIGGGDLGGLLGPNATAVMDGDYVNVTSGEGSVLYNKDTGVLISASLVDPTVGIDTSIKLRVPPPPEVPNWANTLKIGDTKTFQTGGFVITIRGDVYDQGTSIGIEVLSVPEEITFTPETVALALFTPDVVTATTAGYDIDFNTVFNMTVNGEKLDANTNLGYIMQLVTPLAALSDSQFNEFAEAMRTFVSENGGTRIQKIDKGETIDILYTNDGTSASLTQERTDADFSDVISLEASYTLDGFAESFTYESTSSKGIVLTIRGVAPEQEVTQEETNTSLAELPFNSFFFFLAVMILPLVRRRIN